MAAKSKMASPSSYPNISASFQLIYIKICIHLPLARTNGYPESKIAKSKMAKNPRWLPPLQIKIRISQPVFNGFGSKFACTTSRSGLMDIQNPRWPNLRWPPNPNFLPHLQIQISQPVFNRYGSKFACTASWSVLMDIQYPRWPNPRWPSNLRWLPPKYKMTKLENDQNRK